MSRRRPARVAAGVALSATIGLAPVAASAATRNDVAPSRRQAAVDYLKSTQLANGGFDVSDFPGFETPDVVLGLSSAAMVGKAWNTDLAGATVSAVQKDGKTAFDALDDLVDNVEDPTTDAAGAQAAKLLALVVAPTGQSADDFDPSDDSEGAVSLIERMNLHRNEDGSYDFGAQFNGALYAALAADGLGGPVADGLVAQIRAAQRGDGSWNYAGDHDPESAGEVDTTALAVLALKAAGLDTTDSTVAEAVSFLAAGQQASGAWQAFGSDDPNSTSMAIIALSAVQVDVTVGNWTVPFGKPAAANYTTPYAWLASQQQDNGRVASPNDEFGINNFATAQTLQAVSAQWNLRTEQVDLIDALTALLAGSSPAAATEGLTTLGANPSTASARWAAGHKVSMSQAGRELAAEALFQRAFQRGLDSSGRAFWSNELLTDSRSRVLVRLTGSDEFYASSGSTTEGFVENAYRAVLGRSPDTAGRAFWSQRLDAGEPVSIIADDLVASREYRQNEVDLAYQQMLGRNADASGRAFWTEALATTRVEAILAGIGGSAEFYRIHT